MDYDHSDIWESYSSDWDAIPERTVTIYIYSYLHPVFFILGTLGNLLAGVTLLRMSQKTLSTCIYLGVICFVDILLLYVRCGNTWLTQVSDVNFEDKLRKSSKTLCKLVPFVVNLSTHYVTWAMAAYTVESLLMTALRDGVARVCTVTRTRATMFLLIVILVSFDAHSFWTSNLLDAKDFPKLKKTVCVYTKPGRKHSEDIRDTTWPLTELVLMYVLPFMVAFVCTSYKVIKIKENAKNRQKQTKDDSVQQNGPEILLPGSREAERILRPLLVYASVIYIIAILPSIVYKMYDILSRDNEQTDRGKDNKYTIDYNYEAVKDLTKNVCSLPYYLYIAFRLAFFLYISEPFRRQFIGVLFWMDCKKLCLNRKINSSGQMVAPLIVRPPNIVQENSVSNIVTTV